MSRIWHISDTHGFAYQLKVPKDIDIIIHSGDASNWRPPAMNYNEMMDFIRWYEKVEVKHKIYVAGNHDSSIETRMINKEDFKDRGIIYLEHESVKVEDLNIFGSPYTPVYGNWCFMKQRGKLTPYYDHIPDNTNILVTHGPPHGIMDLSFNREGDLEFCGCKELMNRINKLKELRISMFGHIHDMSGIRNNGIMYRNGVYYSNGVLVQDGRFDKGLLYNGNLFEIDENKNIKIIK